MSKMSEKWQATPNVPDTVVTDNYKIDDVEFVDDGVWLIELPIEAQVQMGRCGYAIWIDEFGITWEAEAP